MKINKKNLIVITGPTASGKTSLSIKLAKKNKCSIISCDSRQFYREMNIGTAKPSQSELKSVPHFFIDNLSIFDTYSAGKYATEVNEFFLKYFKQNDNLVMVGGSGLFIDAALKGLDSFPRVSNKIRSKLNQDLELKGLGHLTKLLKRVDPSYYSKTDLKNPRRVIRALEVYKASNKPYSSFTNKKNKYRDDININFFGISPERDELIDRINSRVDLMMENGLLEEAKKLFKYRNLLPLKTVGYTELFSYLEDKMTLFESINLIKTNTRKYSKRQMTWFRKNKEIKWFKSHKIIDQIKC